MRTPQRCASCGEPLVQNVFVRIFSIYPIRASRAMWAAQICRREGAATPCIPDAPDYLARDWEMVGLSWVMAIEILSRVSRCRGRA